MGYLTFAVEVTKRLASQSYWVGSVSVFPSRIPATVLTGFGSMHVAEAISIILRFRSLMAGACSISVVAIALLSAIVSLLLVVPGSTRLGVG